MDEDAIFDLFSSFGPVTIKSMFGGKGIYSDGLIIALEVNDELLLKADLISAPDFEEAGSAQWTYDGKSKPIKMPYWSVPDEALDDTDVFAIWARKAKEAALRAPPKAPKKSAKKSAKNAAQKKP